MNTYTSPKFVNIITFDSICLKCVCIEGSIMEGVSIVFSAQLLWISL